MLRFIRQAQGSLPQEQVGCFQFELEIAQAFGFLQRTDFLADFGVLSRDEGREPTRRSSPRCHGFSQQVGPSIEEGGE